MRIARFSYCGHSSWGVIENDQVCFLAGDPFCGRINRSGEKAPLEAVGLLAPCQASKIVCVGLNYRDHAAELNMKPPTEPILILKPTTAVIGPGDEIVYTPLSSQVDYEAELAVVIGKKARNVPIEEAADHILGYTCVNDVTARDLQRRDGQWVRSKSFDTFCPMGPWIETDLDPCNLKIEALLNGEVKQSSRTSCQIFSPGYLVSYISQIMTLLPGDVISTGTPIGIGPMQVGDEIEVRIEGIGSLKNRVVKS